MSRIDVLTLLSIKYQQSLTVKKKKLYLAIFRQKSPKVTVQGYGQNILMKTVTSTETSSANAQIVRISTNLILKKHPLNIVFQT